MSCTRALARARTGRCRRQETLWPSVPRTRYSYSLVDRMIPTLSVYPGCSYNSHGILIQPGAVLLWLGNGALDAVAGAAASSDCGLDGRPDG